MLSSMVKEHNAKSQKNKELLGKIHNISKLNKIISSLQNVMKIAYVLNTKFD